MFFTIFSVRSKILLFVLIFFGLLIYNFIIVDRVSLHFNLSGGMKSISSISPIGLLSALLLAPLIEESLFRWALVRNEIIKYFLYIFISMCILFFIEIYSGILFISIFSVILFIKNRKNIESELSFRVFILFGSLAFSIIHIPVINGATIMIDILMALLAFFPIGLFFSFVRIQVGIKYSILIHGIYNLIILSINEIIY